MQMGYAIFMGYMMQTCSVVFYLLINFLYFNKQLTWTLKLYDGIKSTNSSKYWRDVSCKSPSWSGIWFINDVILAKLKKKYVDMLTGYVDVQNTAERLSRSDSLDESDVNAYIYTKISIDANSIITKYLFFIKIFYFSNNDWFTM